ncbi:MAG: LrgB family protein [Bacteroides sp.]|nr:LrgB family protein [Bacteroides sp.]MDE6051306.1 LrgB family protein [Paramuribaculum sp.]
MEFLESNVLLISLTFLTYWGALRLQKLTGLLVLNPVLITILVIIGYLKLLGVTYDTYYDSGRMIEFWLKPAIVALGVPLYQQMKQIRRQFLPIFISQLAGCLAGIVSVVLIARWLGATREVVLSLAPKSVTTPIAIEVSQKIGGVASLTAAIVVCVGLLGAILGSKMMTMGRVDSPVARSLSMGTAAHVIGTSRASQFGQRHSAFATLGLILNGVLTALLAGPIVDWIL